MFLPRDNFCNHKLKQQKTRNKNLYQVSRFFVKGLLLYSYVFHMSDSYVIYIYIYISAREKDNKKFYLLT